MGHMRAAVALEPKKYKKQARTLKKYEATKKAMETPTVDATLKTPYDPNGDLDPRAMAKLQKAHP